MRYSTKWKMWVTIPDFRRCLICREKGGKIYDIEAIVYPSPPVHPNCRCTIERLKLIWAGTATKAGENGADWYVKKYGKLPSYYITYRQAKKKGWNPKKGNLSLKCPGKMIFGGIYKNENEHLPKGDNRIWFEADINYEYGYRGADRLLFSNDGLMFVTYDHYRTFIEIE